MNNKILYDFDGFRVDTDQRCLWRGEKLVSLTPKAFETLVCLIKNQGKLVTKDSLLDEVWKETFVGEATLAQNISTLRKTLAEYENGKEFIVTIPRRGYRFVADVTEILADEEILVVEKRSVTRIVAEQETIHDSAEKTGIEPQTYVSKVSPSKYLSKKLIIGSSLAVLIFALAGFYAYSYFSSVNNFYNSKFQKFQINTLFSESNIQGATISPDGKYAAVIKRKTNGDVVLLRQVTDGNTLEILPASNLNIVGAAFSPKSDSIFYTAYSKENNSNARLGKLYKIPILGGASQEILVDVDSAAAISNDNKKLAFIRNKPNEKKSVLIISDIDGSNEKELASRDLRNAFSTVGLSFSPHGKLISTVVSDREDKQTTTKIMLVDTEKGEQTPLITQSWIWIGQTKWLRDGSGIAFVAYGVKSPNLTDEIWLVSYPEGKAKVITNGINGINGISITDDAESIVADKLTRITTTYVSPLDDLEKSTEIQKSISEESLLHLGADWTTDEKIVFSKTNNGNADIWIMNADGTKPKQLTSDESADFAPSVSENYVFYISNRDGQMNIWRMGLNGENQTQLTKTENLHSFSVSQENNSIYFSAKSPDQFYNVLCQVDFEGKNLRQITTKRTYLPKISPDGKQILCYFPDNDVNSENSTPNLRLTLLSADGEVLKQFESLKNNNFPLTEWKKDSQTFLFVENGENQTLWQYSINDEKPEKLKEWKDGHIYQIAVSKDGKRLFYEKGEEVSSIIKLQNIP
jgi:DNA-binding winged helix-turn-helix (wHTH) protein/Tol biopolymer transport system component